LPIGEMHLSGLRYRGARFDVRVRNRGPFLEELRINGTILRGSYKLPSVMIHQGDNSLEVVYGPEPPEWCFREIVNAEVLDVHSGSHRLDVHIRAHGAVDLHLFSPVCCDVMLDNVPVAIAGEGGSHSMSRQLLIHGNHTLSLVRR
jgi:hypothetical protein